MSSGSILVEVAALETGFKVVVADLSFFDAAN
jgi:hypothetical protein